MVAIAFIGTIQHDTAREAVHKLVDDIKAEASSDIIIVCNADGLFLTSSKLGEQLEMLFDSGIDLVMVGEQAISRNCCRSVLAKTEWPVLKPINLSGSTNRSSIKSISHKDESFWFISTAGQNGKIPIDYSYIKLDEFFQNKKDNLPVIINESLCDFKYLQALAWKYSKLGSSVLIFGSGTGLITIPSLQYDNNCLIQCDVGSVVTENTVFGFEPELWWKKNIDRRPLNLLPKWGALKCDYTIVNIEKGKINSFFTKSIRI